MPQSQADQNQSAQTDTVLEAIADYVIAEPNFSELAYDTAQQVLMDSLGCGLLALKYPACRQVLGPIVPQAICPGGARVPGTPFELDPVQATFSLGAMIRWLDFNDTWLAAEWGHPSDNLSGILMLADYLTRQEQAKFTVNDVLTALIKAHEIQGVLALENSFNRVGLDHVVLVKVATAAVTTHMLNGNRQHIIDAVSQAWIDGQALRTYRHAPNTGPRKSWAAADAASRGLRLALLTLQGEPGYASALTAPQWGFEAVQFKNQAIQLARPFNDYVMENILFKIAYPAEFHAQTAAEVAIQHHPHIIERLKDIEKVVIHTQESAVRIISKTGPLHNPADRDHCIQYITAIGLLFGDLTADHYEDKIAADPRIDTLREKMQVLEDPNYSRDYLDPDKRSIANAIQIFFNDGSSTENIVCEYPLGHKRRRNEAAPLLQSKCEANLATEFTQTKVSELIDYGFSGSEIRNLPVPEFINLFLTGLKNPTRNFSNG